MKNDVQPVIIRNPSSNESQASKIGRGRNRITILKKSCIHHDQRKKRTKKTTESHLQKGFVRIPMSIWKKP